MRRPSWSLAAAVYALSACSSGPDTGAVSQIVSAGAATTVAATVGQLAGAAVAVPVGALPEGTRVSIDLGAAPPQAAVAVLGPVVSFRAQQAAGAAAALAQPVEIAVPFDRAALPAGRTAQDLVLFAAAGASASPRTVPGARIDAAAGVARASVALFASYWVAVPTGALTGSYRVFFAGSGFEEETATTPHSAVTNISGASFTLTFAAGGTAVASGWTETYWAEKWVPQTAYHPAPTSVRTEAPGQAPGPFGYTLDASGRLSLTLGGAPMLSVLLAPDGGFFGSLALTQSTNGTQLRAQLDQVVGVRTGAGGAAALKGRFLVQGRRTALDMTAGPEHPSGNEPARVVLSDVGRGTSEVTFDGAGSCAIAAGTSDFFITRFGSPLAPPPPSPTGVSVEHAPSAAAACTYTVDAGGALRVLAGGVELLTGAVDPSGARFAGLVFATAQKSGGTDYMQTAYTGLRLRSGWTAADLAGTYRLVTGAAGFLENLETSVVKARRDSSRGDLALDGAGGCVLSGVAADHAKLRYSARDGVSNGPVGVDWVYATLPFATCSYTVTDGGAATVLVDGEAVTFQASEDGGVLVGLSGGAKSTDGLNTYLVEQRLAIRVP